MRFKTVIGGGTKMKIRRIKKSTEGVVGIVVAVLLIGLLVAVVSLVQMVYVPKWMREKEAEHMDQVVAQFAQLKSSIDLLSIINKTGIPIATPITLGSGELPFLMSMKSYGYFEIMKDACIISVASDTYTNSSSLGIIKFTAVNAYYIPEQKQSFIYESGAFITSQTNGSDMSIKPSFTISKSPFNVITFTIINVTGVGNKISSPSGGYGTIAIQTEFSKSNNTIIPSVRYINITTPNSNAWQAWNSSLNSTFKKYEVGNVVTPITDGISIRLTDFWTMDLRFVEIFAQIGPGWVET